MGPCNHYADRWLDHLYGLLEQEESRELTAHLTDCVVCQTSMVEAQRDQKWMARAAQWRRDIPVFDLPAGEKRRTLPGIAAHGIAAHGIAAHIDEPATLPIPTKTERPAFVRRTRFAWAAAAAVLLAVFGSTVLYRQGAQSREATVADAKKQLDAVEGKFVALKTQALLDQLAVVHQSTDEGTTHLVHLASSKSVAQHGEVIFFRALVLERATLKPPANPVPLTFALAKGKDKAAIRVTATTGPDGIAAGEFAVGPNVSAGLYRIEVAAGDAKVQMASLSRGIEVVERLSDWDLRPDRAVYRPGDKVVIRLNARDKEGQPLKNQMVVMKPDFGKKGDFSLSSGTRRFTDAAGNALVEFEVPKDAIGGRIPIQIDLPGTKKAKVVRTISVVPSRLDVDFYPEGGDLVAGVPQRIFYRVRTPGGETASPDGTVTITSAKGTLYESKKNESLGSFTLTYDPKETYTLKVPAANGPIETKDPFQKLHVKQDGIVFHVANSVASEGDPVRVELRRLASGGELLIVASCRGKVVGQKLVDANARAVELKLPSGTHGTIRVTVYDLRNQQATPVAERLIYRAPSQRLDITAKAQNLQPGGTANATIESRDEQGRSASAWALAMVVEDQYRAERQERSLTGHFLVAGDLSDDLADALILLDDTAAGRDALELYLGAYGWRRFVAQPQAPVQVQPELIALQERVNRERASLEDEREQRAVSFAAAVQTRGEYGRRPWEYFRLGMGLLAASALLAGSLLLVWGVVRITRQRPARNPFAWSMASVGFCLVLFLTAGTVNPDGTGQPGEDQPRAQQPWPQINVENVKPLAFSKAQRGGHANDWAHAFVLNENSEGPRAASLGNFVQHPQLRERFDATAQAQQAPGTVKMDREYAHRRQAGFDAPPTLLWHPNLRVEAGQAKVAFDLPAAAGTYRLLVYGHDGQGRLGFHESRLKITEVAP